MVEPITTNVVFIRAMTLRTVKKDTIIQSNCFVPMLVLSFLYIRILDLVFFYKKDHTHI